MGNTSNLIVSKTRIPANMSCLEEENPNFEHFLRKTSRDQAKQKSNDSFQIEEPRSRRERRGFQELQNQKLGEKRRNERDGGRRERRERERVCKIETMEEKREGALVADRLSPAVQGSD